jgi:hypothetical protein
MTGGGEGPVFYTYIMASGRNGTLYTGADDLAKASASSQGEGRVGGLGRMRVRRRDLAVRGGASGQIRGLEAGFPSERLELSLVDVSAQGLQFRRRLGVGHEAARRHLA